MSVVQITANGFAKSAKAEDFSVDDSGSSLLVAGSGHLPHE